MVSDATAAEANALMLVEEARRAGFHRVGVATVEPWARHEVYERWVAAGYAGEMAYLDEQRGERRDPRALMAGARTLVTVGLSYAAPERAGALAVGGRSAAAAAPGTVPPGGTVPGTVPPTGVIARYARGGDYHTVMKSRLLALGRAVSARLGREVAQLACVDTAPLLEREAAHRGGVGFLAKNTMIIAPGLGSYLLLGELLLGVEAASTAPAEPRCGRCRACLDACPTGAFVDEYQLDARRCIAYLTIEARGAIPRELRPAVEDMVFGCDRCQEVCPFNGAPGDHGGEGHGEGEPALAALPRMERPLLVELLGMGAARFRKFVKRTALRRIHRAQLLRNVAVALGNTGRPDEIAPLAAAFDEPSALVREHVAWAIARIAARHPGDAALGAAVQSLLRARLAIEDAPSVREEIALALAAAPKQAAPTPPP